MIYSFNLSDFESGRFVATRFPDNAAVSGDWICRASSDEQALVMARRSAAEEWSAPESRPAWDFDVEFVDANAHQSDDDKNHNR